MWSAPWIFFGTTFGNFWSGAKFFGRPAPDTPISSHRKFCIMVIFGQKSVFFQLLRSCRGPKWGGFHENFFENTFGCFWPGPKKFLPPRTHNPHFRPQKFLHMAIFRRKKPKIAIFCLFRLKIGQKRAKIKKKCFRQIFLSVNTFSKKSQKWPQNGIGAHRAT